MQPASLLVGTIDNHRVRTRGLHLYDDSGTNPGANTIPRFGTDGRVLFSTAQVDACGAIIASSLTLSGGLITYAPPSGLAVNGIPLAPLLNFRTRSFLPRATIDIVSIPVAGRCIPGALAENGKIYCQYDTSTNTLVIDTAINITSSVQKILENFNTAVYGYNNTIYYSQLQYGQTLAPCTFVKFNTQTNIQTIVPVSNSLFLGSFYQNYFGTVLGLNGLIYCIPAISGANPFGTSHKLLYINTNNDTCGVIIVPLLADTNAWAGGALDFSGNIYCAPFYGDNVLVINTTTDTASSFSVAPSSANQHWYGSVLAPNGKIYSVPYNADSILVIDPATSATSTIALGASIVAAGWAGGVLGMDGKIYCIPYNSNNVLVIDPATDTFSTIPTGVTGAQKWRGGVLGPNGTIYGIPYNASSVLIIRPGVPMLQPWMIGPEFNKF